MEQPRDEQPIEGPAPSGVAPPMHVEVLADDRPCLNCGYNLRGLHYRSVCPECGTPVERSLQGNLLVYSSRAYVASLHHGVTLVLVAALLEIALTACTVAAIIVLAALNSSAGPNAPITTLNVDLLASVIALPVAAMSLFGWWLFSAPDPAIVGAQRGQTPRRVVRAAVIVAAAAAAVELASRAVITSGPQAEIAVGLLALLDFAAWAASFFASMLYVGWLASRLPDSRIGDRARLYLWLLPLIYVIGAICLFLGPLVALIMYLLLLNQVRLRLAGIRRRQAHEAT